ncbi:hypothetical protein [Paraburkholderia aspalathi]|uniref:Uncharacterized protein n=1 Tax=Paraburkholderia aspalathi TaxID=1324617 RepID=A0A1I7ENW4_9BURK|nr:hypothetical protein [Paraburkholderia aspalathi]SFU25628.1 hypothetical protein SAMN05192563_103932 [Paraburkholderia aspalathi]
MSKKSFSDSTRDPNETTPATLTALTTQIIGFVREGTLDSRFAAKLVKRMKKEAEAILEADNATKSDWKELKKAFDTVDAVLREHDARLLVTANAALRASDDLPDIPTPR